MMPHAKGIDQMSLNNFRGQTYRRYASHAACRRRNYFTSKCANSNVRYGSIWRTEGSHVSYAGEKAMGKARYERRFHNGKPHNRHGKWKSYSKKHTGNQYMYSANKTHKGFNRNNDRQFLSNTCAEADKFDTGGFGYGKNRSRKDLYDASSFFSVVVEDTIELVKGIAYDLFKAPKAAYNESWWSRTNIKNKVTQVVKRVSEYAGNLVKKAVSHCLHSLFAFI